MLFMQCVTIVSLMEKKKKSTHVATKFMLANQFHVFAIPFSMAVFQWWTFHSWFFFSLFCKHFKKLNIRLLLVYNLFAECHETRRMKKRTNKLVLPLSVMTNANRNDAVRSVKNHVPLFAWANCVSKWIQIQKLPAYPKSCASVVVSVWRWVIVTITFHLNTLEFNCVNHFF